MGNMDGNQPICSPSSEGDPFDEDDTSVLPKARARRAVFPLPQSHWFPRPIVFRTFKSCLGKKQRGLGLNGGGRLHIQVSRPLPFRLSKDLVETYQLCNPKFVYSDQYNPKRYLTHPSVGVSNNGYDNVNHDFILYFGGTLVNEDGTRRYLVKELVGCGTFGQVAKCLTLETNEYVAVKVIKNQPAYSTQAKVEIGILHVLNNICDWKNKHHVVRSYDHFLFQNHLCIVFELLGVNLYELLKMNQHKGISLYLVRIFTSQLLDALALLQEGNVIHCDVKPENILLTRYGYDDLQFGNVDTFQEAKVKLIDFGSACMEDQTVYSYIQSRFYRSPEVALGHPYSTSIDMWSLGCVAAELFLGLPLFPGQSAYDLLLFTKEILGTQPPDHILNRAKHTNKFFKVTSAAPQSAESGGARGQSSYFKFLTPEEYEARDGKKPSMGKRYNFGNLEKMIMEYHMKSMPEEEKEKELYARRAFADFLRGLVEIDPKKRWTARQAAHHPFLTKDAFLGPFKPQPETPRMPVGQSLMMEHGAGLGHWSGAGLSPQVSKMSSMAQLNGSPQFQSYAMASSCGSPASFGSFGDSGALGSSFGSYTDTGLSMSYPAGPSGQNSLLGGSPDGNWHHFSPSIQGSGQTQLGMSPSVGGGCRPLSLGASPSHQFNSSGAYFQASPSPQFASSPGSQYIASPGNLYQGSFQSSPGSSFRSPSSPSQGSPNRYGPTSPAHAVREAALVGQYKQRRGTWPAPIPSGVSYHENVHWQRLQQSNASGNIEVMHSQGGPRMVPPWRPARPGGSSVMLHHPKTSSLYAPGSLGSHMFTSETSTEAGGEESPAGPGDWDADFRDELLLENDPFPDGTGFTLPPGVRLPDGVMGSGGARLGPGPGSGPFSGPGPGTSLVQSHSLAQLNGHASTRMGHGKTVLPMNVEGSPTSLQSSLQSLQTSYGRNQTIKHGQTSPSRLGQQHWQQQHQYPQQMQPPQYLQSPQQSPDFITSGTMPGPTFGPNSGPPSRKYLGGEGTFNSPAGIRPFQQRQQQQYHSPQQSPDHQPLPSSPIHSGVWGHKAGHIGSSSSSSEGLLPSPQRDLRDNYIPNGNSDGSFPGGPGFPMTSGIGQPPYGAPSQVFSTVDGSPIWPAHAILVPQGQIFANGLFTGRKAGPPLVGVVRPSTVQRDFWYAQ